MEEGAEVEVSAGSEGALKSVWLLRSHPVLFFRVFPRILGLGCYDLGP